MNEKIFISIASYLDPMLFFTVSDAIAKAQHPELLAFGIVNQDFEDQRKLLCAAAACTGAGMRYLHAHPHDTLGVSWARHLAYSLYDEETFFLQIDSHTLFESAWDETLRKQLRQLQELSAKPICTTYPEGFTLIDGLPQWTPNPPDIALIIRPLPQTTLSHDYVLIQFRALRVGTNQPVPGCHIAGGFLFCSGKFIEEVPYDPYLYFWGEEQSLSIRAFTHGWDIYHPTAVPLYHLYRDTGSNHAQLHWTSEVDQQRQLDSAYLTKRSNVRLMRLLCGDGLPGVYGLGKIRTIDEFSLYSGIDYKRKSIHDPYGGKFPGLPLADEHLSTDAVVLLDEAA